jgi:hypothetical protein
MDIDYAADKILWDQKVLQVASHDDHLGMATTDQMKHRISMLDRVAKVLLA